MNASAAWKPKESDSLEYCAAYDPKRSFQLRNYEKHTSSAIMWKKMASSMKLWGKLLWDESEFKTYWQWACNSRKSGRHPKTSDSPSKTFQEMMVAIGVIVWVILQVPRMGKMRMMSRQSRASGAVMKKRAGWWAQLPERDMNGCRGFGKSRRSLTNSHKQDERMQPTASVKEMRSTAHLNWGFRQWLHRNWMIMQQHLHREHLETS